MTWSNSCALVKCYINYISKGYFCASLLPIYNFIANICISIITDLLITTWYPCGVRQEVDMCPSLHIKSHWLEEVNGSFFIEFLIILFKSQPHKIQSQLRHESNRRFVTTILFLYTCTWWGETSIARRCKVFQIWDIRVVRAAFIAEGFAD